MKKQALALAIILLNTLSIHYCLAMESSITIIDNGLLTELPAKIAITKSQNNHQPGPINQVHTKKDTLIKLMYYRKAIGNDSTELFCPIVLKRSEWGPIGETKNLGQFNPYKHKEAIEACRFNKAIYWSMGQGVIIYNVKKQPVGLSAFTKEFIEELLIAHSQEVFIPNKQSRY